tara:strand:+ start:69 stop:674 length:606 start_codon:yes stop_codon:yes gene_type:complete
MTVFVGLTGGIATGKSTVVKFLQKKGYKVHDSDLIVKKIYSQPEKQFFVFLKKIGLSKAINNKKINKNVIRNEIFTDGVKKKKLEKFIHKKVKISRSLFIKKNKNKKNKIIFFDIPLLFEAKLSHICHYIILLYAPKKIKIERALKRKNTNKDIIKKILKNQISDKIKKKKSDYIINTSKPKKHSFKMILEAINNILDQNA